MIPFNHLGLVFNTFGSVIYSTAIRKVLCNFLKTLPQHSKVLDVGAGTGMLCKFGHQCRDDLKYVAVDPAEGMMKYAGEYVQTYKATAEALPFEDKSFDIVMMGESLHHFRDVDEGLSETVRVLKKSGKLFIYDFDVSKFMGKSICKIEKLLGEPGNFYEPKKLKEKLESFGFTVTIKQYGWRYVVLASLV